MLFFKSLQLLMNITRTCFIDIIFFKKTALTLQANEVSYSQIFKLYLYLFDIPENLH